LPHGIECWNFEIRSFDFYMEVIRFLIDFGLIKLRDDQ